VRVSTWVWTKSAGFTQNDDSKRQLCPEFSGVRGTFTSMPSALEYGKSHALGA